MRFLIFLMFITCLNAEHRFHDHLIVVCKINTNRDEERCECSSHIVDCTFKTQSSGSLKSVNLRLDNSFDPPKKVILNKNSINIFEQNKLFFGKENSIEVLELKENELKLIEFNAFDNFKSLKSLVLSNNLLTIDYGNSGWITEKLGASLQTLYLNNNHLSHLPNEVFDKLRILEILDLDDNPNLKLSSNTFGYGLSNLKELSLIGCNLNILPNGLFNNLRSLKRLSLVKNSLTSISTQLKALNNLQVLDFGQTSLDKLQKDAFIDVPNIIRLKLNAIHELKQIDDCAFCGLTQLQTVDISNSTQLTQIDEKAFGLARNFTNATHNLQVLHADNCQVDVFPSSLLKWKSMKLAKIAGNPLNCNKMEWLVNDTGIVLFTGFSGAPRCHNPIERRGEFLRLYDVIGEEKKTKRTSVTVSLTILVVFFVLTIACICCMVMS